MKMISDIDWEWVHNHLNDDPVTLTLKYGAKRRNEILQIDCRQRTHKKLAHTLLTDQFIFPSLLASQQCSSDATARFHASLINDGELVLDMTSGLGIDACHLSRRADRIYAIDIKEENTLAAIHNARQMDIDNIHFSTGDSVEWLKNSALHFNTIFIDPSRRDNNNRRCYGLETCSPDVLKLMPLFRAKTDKLIIKVSPMLDITSLTEQIRETTAIYVVGTEKECKELIIMVDFTERRPADLFAVTITDSETVLFRIPPSKQNYNIGFDNPKLYGYIYLPFPSLMKIDASRFLGENYGLSQIAPSTHLLSSEKLISEFPGRTFKVLEILRFDKKTINNFRKQYPEINITAKNFPYPAPRLASILKVKEGGRLRLFAVSLSDNSRVLIVTEPV